MRYTRRISIRSLSSVSYRKSIFVVSMFCPVDVHNILIQSFDVYFLFVHSDWDRNVELAQLIQQKLDAYKAGKFSSCEKSR